MKRSIQESESASESTSVPTSASMPKYKSTGTKLDEQHIVDRATRRLARIADRIYSDSVFDYCEDVLTESLYKNKTNKGGRLLISESDKMLFYYLKNDKKMIKKDKDMDALYYIFHKAMLNKKINILKFLLKKQRYLLFFNKEEIDFVEMFRNSGYEYFGLLEEAQKKKDIAEENTAFFSYHISL
jgi:hypothetical protein